MITVKRRHRRKRKVAPHFQEAVTRGTIPYWEAHGHCYGLRGRSTIDPSWATIVANVSRTVIGAMRRLCRCVWFWITHAKLLA